ncbi:MAG TPA: DinB family protein [Bryobacteraceae bacterium]|nr:DinB family protein [Bryobacteraceae bacterium]
MHKLTVLAALLALATPVFAADEAAIRAKHWQTSKDFTLAVAEAMPAADYNFKPNDAEMSFGKVMAHIAIANNRAFATVSGLKAPETPANIAAAYKDPNGTFDKQATVQFLRDSFDFCLKALADITPAKLDATTGGMTGEERLWAYFTHTAHHRGQAEVYLRVKNIKPPDYRF